MKKIIASVFAASLLVGCGGSGGSVPPPVEETNPLIPLDPSTPVVPEEDKDNPLIPLEPSIPVDPEEDKDEPLIPLEPSTPLPGGGEDMTPVEPSTPITIETLASVLDEPVAKLKALFADGTSTDISWYFKSESEPVIKVDHMHGFTVFDVMGSTVTHYSSVSDTRKVFEDSLFIESDDKYLEFEINSYNSNDYGFSVYYTAPYTTDNIYTASSFLKVYYSYEDVLSDSGFTETYEQALGIWWINDDSREEYLVKVLRKFADVPMTDLEPSTPPSQEQQFADITGFSVDSIKGLVDGEQHLSVHVTDGMPYISMTDPNDSYGRYTYQINLMNASTSVSAHKPWTNGSMNDYLMTVKEPTLDGVVIGYEFTGESRWTVFNGTLTILAEMELTEQVADLMFEGDFSQGYTLIPLSGNPNDLVESHVSTSPLFLSQDKRDFLEEILMNYAK